MLWFSPMREMMVASEMFLLGVIETAIGAALGFVLGMVAFHYQSRNEQQLQQQLERDAANDALFRMQQAAVVNIETLASAKKQLLAQLPEESAVMKGLINEYYQADEEGKQQILTQMRRARTTSLHSTWLSPSQAC